MTEVPPSNAEAEPCPRGGERLDLGPQLSESEVVTDRLQAASECVLLSRLRGVPAAEHTLAAHPHIEPLLITASEGGWALSEHALTLRAWPPMDLPIGLPAMAHMLARHQERIPGAAEAAETLRSSVAHWLWQRLWAENRVRELVVHDERHTKRVDVLAVELVAPLLLEPVRRVTAEDALVLSAAAWLHDWGHEGGEVPPDYLGTTVPLSVESASDVRDLHGIVTRELLERQWKARHGLEARLASLVGILCAHHQGWTSFGHNRPARVLAGLPGTPRVTPPNLVDDVRRHNDEYPPAVGRAAVHEDTVRLLVALLRVADGCDVGIHRVPDAGRSKDTYLARAVQLQCRRTQAELLAEALDRGGSEEARAAVGEVSTLAEHVGSEPLRGDAGPDSLPARMARKLAPHLVKRPVRRLLDYIAFAAGQDAYHQSHQSVRSVWFDVESQLRRLVPHEVTVWVSPSGFGRDSSVMAAETVRTDLQKELKRGDWEGQVRECLMEAGLRFVSVRDTATGTTLPLT
jgi:hypothetical protein